MTKGIFKRVFSVFLAMVMVISVYIPSFAGNADKGNKLVTESEVEEFMADIGVTDPADAENGHAYDPFAEMKEQQAEEEYRESVEVVEGKILFSVRDVRADGEKGVYLTDESALCKNASLTNVSFVLETVNKTAATENGQVAYDVYYEATTNADVWETVDALNETEGVLYAEPDFIWENTAVGSYTEISSAEIQHGHHHGKLESEKNWGNIEESNGSAPGENVVVAVIDTGIDYAHEDLKNSMWTNWFEIPDNGIDDDYNGYVDDYYGYDFIESHGDPMDDNGHGTHVAGIIAMEPNKKGGVGVAYGAKIMAIKAGQANGTFASTDIAKAINYAVANGADVINMSFGGTGKSSLVEAALQDAFGTAVLVAAAGNNGYTTLDAPDNYPREDIYPAGYSYVIGVMASDEGNTALASFSNWDYIVGANCEYEMVAPGSAIYSTIPGNRYASWNGTSMAAPMVSAAAAMIRSKYQDRSMYSSRFIMGQLVSATDDIIVFEDLDKVKHLYPSLNIEDSLNKIPTPDVYVSEMYIVDSTDISSANNGDGIMQVGETVDILFSVSNRWGIASNVAASIDTTFASSSGIPNPYVDIINGSVSFEDIGTYMSQNNGYIYTDGMLTGATDPIRIKIHEDAPNDAMVTFAINISCTNGMDAGDTATYESDPYKYTFVIQNGFTFSGIINEDMTLTADKYWIIDNYVYIPQGVTVTVEPGTQIQFWSSDANDPYATDAIVNIAVDGEFIAKGTADKPIEMFPSKAFEKHGVYIRWAEYSDDYISMGAYLDYADSGNIELSYVNIVNPLLNINNGDHLNIVQTHSGVLYRHIFEGSSQVIDMGLAGGWVLVKEELSDSSISCLTVSINNRGTFKNVLFDNCCFQNTDSNGVDVLCAEDQSFIDCVFLMNQNKYEKNPYAMNLVCPGSDMNLTNSNATASEIYNFNGKKYVVWHNFFVPTHPDYESGNNQNSLYLYDIYNTLANNRGGSLVSINTDENAEYDELDFLIENMDVGEAFCIIGGYSDPYDPPYTTNQLGQQVYDYTVIPKFVSPDGTEINADIECDLNSYGIGDRYFMTMRRNDEGTVYLNGVSSMRYSSFFFENNAVAFEYPESVSDEEILKQFSQEEIIRAYTEVDGSKIQFSNNAILSQLTNTDTSLWMSLVAPSISDYTYLAANNYWGTENEKLIQLQIMDADDSITFGNIVHTPYLTLASSELETIYPFVTEAYVTDMDGNKLDVVSGGRVQMHVKFNRDMAQDIDPMVSFGGAEPYTDYVVNGDWASAREWIAEINITPYINQGVMYIRVKGGAAADDNWLVCGTDVGRFSFEISKTGAQSMTLQGIGEAGKNVLSWMQDDYETLAGYNIYRSTSYDNTVDVSEQNFEKINPYLMVGESFEDENVSVGTDYYYYFTVMDTAFNESEPSNVVECTPKEAEPPTIKVPTVMSTAANAPIRISTEVTDNVAVTGVKLYYKMDTSANWASIDMRKTTGNSYQAIIAAYEVKTGAMLYYISATDGNNTAYYGTTDEPSKIVIGHEHDWDDGVETKPTCVADGAVTYTCSVCGTTYKETIPATGEHNYSDEFTIDIEPTTETAGEKSRHCLDCDARTDITEIPVITVVKGDIDGDGEVSPLDYFQLKLILAQKIAPTEEQKQAANVDGSEDMDPDMLDSFAFKFYLAKGYWG